MSTPSPGALQFISPWNMQFANIRPSGSDENIDNSSNITDWFSDINELNVSPEELVAFFGVSGTSDLSLLQKLPVEECDRIRNFNSSLWFLFTTYANVTGEFKCLKHAPELSYGIKVKVAVLTAMAILSLVGNAWTIFSIRMNRSGKRSHQTWSAVYTLIMHLSIVDLLVTLFCIAGEAAWSYTVAWRAGNVECKVFKFLQMFSLYLSTFVLVLIGIDRFVVVKYPMKSLNTAKRLNRLIVLIWILSLVFSIPQVSLLIYSYYSVAITAKY